MLNCVRNEGLIKGGGRLFSDTCMKSADKELLLNFNSNKDFQVFYVVRSSSSMRFVRFLKTFLIFKLKIELSGLQICNGRTFIENGRQMIMLARKE